MLLQIYFRVSEENGQAFEDMFDNVYVPAMQVQEGYVGSRLLRLFPPEVHAEIEARDTEFEENRRKWADSDEHQVAFPKAKELA